MGTGIGILDSVGSAVGEVVEDGVGALSKIPDPIAMGIETVGKALGLDPKLTGLIEIGVGAATGDVMCGVHGANDVLNSKSSGERPSAGYAPSGSSSAGAADSGTVAGSTA